MSKQRKIQLSKFSIGFITAGFILLGAVPVSQVLAHGEHAQMASIRTKTIHWFDTKVSGVDLDPETKDYIMDVNDKVRISGKFYVSEFWPAWLPSVEGSAFLTMGVPGPSFVRKNTILNGVHQIRSSTFYKGGYYEYSADLIARYPGRWHVHPLVNVWEAGPMVGDGDFITINGSMSDFENTATLITGETVELESYGLRTQVVMHVFWFITGALWIAYWFRKRPVLMYRYVMHKELDDDQLAQDKLITLQDVIVSAGAVLFVLVGTAGWLVWTQQNYPVTIPLQASKIVVPKGEIPAAARGVEVKIVEARFNLPLRNFRLDIEVSNQTGEDVALGEYVSGNTRFVNAAVLPDVIKLNDIYDPVAVDGLHVQGGNPVIKAGQTRAMTIFVADALWEELALTSIAQESDMSMAGLFFFYDRQGRRKFTEAGAMVIPIFDPQGKGFQQVSLEPHPGAEENSASAA